ncbi:palmitoyltransferase PFA3 KNAG_0K02570 [Huiozyma naganishii CBS 8797]|uniref:Palmitoyltransferase n=1 Tax=Huiozyma naganishii (strain ATCC MYA-139 / BCRC 22969 / CBS 8797 / KCTC 17520 / NBRC 10181 / NCYC 3082 / Yp74L-3) TaxID=1071383 RepID=J7RCM4_HUIN7|nr:hypothetical protein KNAG_0K02570 [Kazachstania naganishii CBS 8797]CCK72620.1 hypothetical protein KNAG_0K02570 [Kazachstania naganishii CBS 8797]
MVSVTSLFPKVLTVTLFAVTGYLCLEHVDVLSPCVVDPIVFLMVSLALYTYFRVINVGPGYPSDFPALKVLDMSAAEAGTELPPEYLTKRSLTVKKDGRFRVCQSCRYWKPDRCHHCSSCDRCILKMDHHCPWIAGCVGFRNQKLFIQFLLYTTAYAIFVLSMTSVQLYRWFYNDKFQEELISGYLLFLWIFSLVVFIAMTLFSAFSVSQVLKNQTTIEMYGVQRWRNQARILGDQQASLHDVNIFNLGSWRKNWDEVMGHTLYEWLLPITVYKHHLGGHSLDNQGVFFRVDLQLNQSILESANLQERLTRRVTPRSSLDVDSRPLIR